MIAATNDDYTGLDYAYEDAEASSIMKKIQQGITRLGPNLVPDFGDPPEDAFPRSEWVEDVVNDYTDASYDAWLTTKMDHYDRGEDEFSSEECDCCHTTLAGARFRFAILADEWTVVEQAGYANEIVVSTWTSFDDADTAMHELYTEDEIAELHVDIMKNGSCEY
jgi:hypothetical protein